MMSLARPSLARLTRSRGHLLPIVGWTLFGLLAAVVARSSNGSGADHVLRGTFAFVVLPLVAYGVVGVVLGGQGLRASLRGVVALGRDPSRAALGSVLTAMAAAAIACGVVGVLVCAIAHGETDPPLARDLPATFGVALVGGAAYAAFFCAGSAIGGGAMRGVFLTLDLLVGMPAGAAALVTPRAHVTSLLGGPLCYELSRRASSVALVVLALAYLALAVVLGRRPVSRR